MNSQADFARALFDPAASMPGGLTTWNRSDPAVRFAVYRNNVVLSLIDALVDTFPVVQELVGEEFFRAMAKVFVQSNRPRSRLMAYYGGAFPEFVASFAPAASLPYLADVARLEMARVHAYHSADASAVNVDQLQAALTDAQQLVSMRWVLHPSVHVIESSHAICSLWAAHQGLLDLTSVDPNLPQTTLVFRSALEVEILEIPAASARFVVALQGGQPLPEAASLAEAEAQAFDLSGTLALLIRLQLITDITNLNPSHEHTL
jgi:hypothetical protein